MKKQKGFTLIELMVVMAIIAILATAGLTAYSSYRKKARDSARAQIARQLMTKVEELANGGPTPTPAQFLAFLIAENFAPISGGLLDIDPLHGEPVCYGAYSGTFLSYCAFTYGTFGDGTYFISYPVEHLDNLTNIWITGPSYNSDSNEYTSGNIIGTNPYLKPENIGTNGAYWTQDISLAGTGFYSVDQANDLLEISQVQI